MSVDVLAVLRRQEEAIFLLLCSIGNTALLMAVFQDVRCFAAGLLLVSLGTAVVSDACFRTTKHTAATAVATGPAFVMFGMVTFFHLIDAGPRGYIELRIGRVEVGVAEMALNVNLTIALLMFRILYKRRHLLCNTQNKTVRCAVYRPTLALWSSRPPAALLVASDASHLQPLRAISLERTTIDASQVLAPSCSGGARCLSFSWLWCHSIVGFVGFTLSLCTCVLPSEFQLRIGRQANSDLLPTVKTIQAIPVAGFMLSLLYVMFVVPSFQRQLLTMLLLNFNVFFLVCQAGLAVWCLSDMLAHDYRTWGVATWMLWFVWVLLSDALTPCTKATFRVRKRHLAAVLFGVYVCLVYSLIALMFTTPMDLHGRTVFEWQLSEFRTLKISTAPFYMNRMFPLTARCIRLFWDLWWSADNALIVLRGDAEYFCPMERYPVPKPAKPSTSPRLESVRQRITSRLSKNQVIRVSQIPVAIDSPSVPSAASGIILGSCNEPVMS